jgi:hypothetical protein
MGYQWSHGISEWEYHIAKTFMDHGNMSETSWEYVWEIME